MAEDMDKQDRAKQIDERAKASLEYMSDTYYPRWSGAFRDFKCLAKPVYKLDANGNETKDEDKTRTNVAMPTPNKIVRTAVARLTAQPPTIGYRCANPEIAAKLTAWSFMQYDRSGERKQHRRVTFQGEVIGWSASKLRWEDVVLKKKFAKQLIKNDNSVGFTNRNDIYKAAGLSPDEMDAGRQAAIQQYGNDYADKMHEDEVLQYAGELGSSINVNQELKKYEGPCAFFVFAGDLLWEPGVLELNNSEWIIESYVENELWLAKKANLTYKDPETGEEKPVFDKAVCDQLLADNPGPEKNKTSDDLRRLFRDATAIQDPDQKMDKRLMGKKRFDVREMHELRQDGMMWITWVANKKYLLGEMPYPWDLGGRSVYTEYVPMPDMISNVGDSAIILGRYLHALDNANEGQKVDLINKLLRRTMLVEKEKDIPPEAIRRLDNDYLVVGNAATAAAAFLPDPDVPSSAWEQTANIARRWAHLDPTLNTVDTGTGGNPLAGKLATTAILNAKQGDVLTQDKVACMDAYLKELGEKKLAMLQEMAPLIGEPIEVPSRYVKDKAWSDRFGQTATITIDPYEIQEDIEVEPEAGSMLAVDDEINKQSAQEFFMMASQNPDVLDKRYAAERYAATVRGVDGAKAVVPPPDNSPQPPETRVNVSVSVKWGELPVQVQQQILASGGVQITPDLATDMQAAEKMRAVSQLSDAADAATNLTSEAHPPQEPKVPGVANA